MEQHAPSARGQPARALVPLCLVFYLHNFLDELVAVPTMRVMEKTICSRYYGRLLDPVGVAADEPELRCKVEAVQRRVLLLLGRYYFVECLPTMATAVVWGHVGDRYGRRLALAVSCVGRFLALLGILVVGMSHDTLPPALMLLVPLLKCIGGGSRVFSSMVFSVASDLTQSVERTKLLFFMALLMDVANVTAPPVVAWLLGHSLWLPFYVASTLLAAVLVFVWALPDTRNDRPSAAPGPEAEHLLRVVHTPPRPAAPFWKSLSQQLTVLVSDRRVFLLLGCSFFKQTAIFSEKFFAQYASETYHLPYSKAAWFSGIQATGALFSLALVLPKATSVLRRRLPSQWAVDRALARTSLLVLVFAYSAVWLSWNVALFAAAVFLCGLGEGAEPAMQALASSLVVPAQYSLLFATMTLLESAGRLVGSPLMAMLLRIGRDDGGRPTGLVFAVSAGLFLVALVGLLVVPGDAARRRRPADDQSEATEED